MVLSFPLIHFTVKACSAFSLFGKPWVEFLRHCWISFSCICSYLFLGDPQLMPQYSHSALYSNQTSNKSCISLSVKENFLPFCFKVFQLKNKLCFSTIFFIYFFSEKFMIQQARKTCHNSVSTCVKMLCFHFAISGKRVLNSLNQISSKWILNREPDWREMQVCD